MHGFAARKRSKKVISRLWGNGKGRFRTTGRHSAATVRGTIWLTEERCDGTLTRVTRGSVTVRDTTARRTVVVRAGRSYLARAQRAAAAPAGLSAHRKFARRSSAPVAAGTAGQHVHARLRAFLAARSPASARA